jgi:hypothetical protein
MFEALVVVARCDNFFIANIVPGYGPKVALYHRAFHFSRFR